MAASRMYLSISPHIRSKISTTSIMLDVIIALLPTTIAGCVIFGLRSLVVVTVCVLAAVASEFIFNLIMKKDQTIGDLSAVVTGLLLGLNLTASIPLWQAAVGSVFAIIIVKCIFGGLGCNVVNPAITARVFMLIAFTAVTSSASPTIVDTASGATPLDVLKGNDGSIPSILNLFLGIKGGAIGEVCIVALIIGGIYLIVRRVITWHIPVTFIATVFIFSFIFADFDFNSAIIFTLSGGLFIGAIFMATDYVTSPSTPLGKIIFAFGAGFITVIIRFYAIYPEGVSFAILLMNIVNPYIETLTKRKIFGGREK